MTMRAPLGRARGLGSAKQGSGHWWAQRLTSLALIPLGLWFAASVVGMAGADYYTMRAWVGSPLVAGLLILLVIAVFCHAYQGMQVVIEDYVHHEGVKLAGLLIGKAAAILLGLAGVLSVLIVLFKG
jgi:succinate dehydrogenase / fumarate reductase membrane anchor subunit